jgi:threonine dehydratase
MPYITQTARQVIADGGPVTTAGELNYAITAHFLDKSIGVDEAFVQIEDEIKKYIAYRGVSYGAINDVVGALECSRREVKRRRGIDVVWFSRIANEFYDAIAAPYEDQKIQQNGDVY